MLTLTSNAIEAVKTMAEVAPELPSNSGLRIHAEPAGEDQLGVELTLVEGPDEDDYVIEEAGARVFVEPETVVYLEDKILDATIAGDRVRFTFSDQE